MRWAVAFSLSIVLSACGLNRPPGTLQSLEDWSGSATLSENGSIVTATYDDWPMGDVPLAYACTEEPESVFAGEGQSIVLGSDPRCVPFSSSLDGSRLTLSIDRAAMPQAFEGLEVWSYVLAMATREGDWSVVAILPADLPDPLAPQGTP
jgi:hypothetical protein